MYSDIMSELYELKKTHGALSNLYTTQSIYHVTLILCNTGASSLKAYLHCLKQWVRVSRVLRAKLPGQEINKASFEGW